MGTLIHASGDKSAHATWIAHLGRPQGTITIDQGAAKALIENGGSLLPCGLIAQEGHFERGDLLAIATDDGRVVAKGLSNYNTGDLSQILGKQSDDVTALLGPMAATTVVHRNNLVLED